MMNTVYLDNNATTPLAPEVLEAMLPVLRENYGNPSSSHPIGQRAGFLVAKARNDISQILGVKPSELIFTSGGTESDHLAIRGILGANPHKRHLITTAVEHEAILKLCHRLEKEGVDVTYLAVDSQGQINLEDLRSAIRTDTALVSIMAANNETGILFPIESIGTICREREIPFHTDAVQAVGKIGIDLGRWPIDLLSASAHKFHGPKGAGLLYVRQGLPLQGQQLGGHQESGHRAGTENVAGIVGMGAAFKLIPDHLRQMETKVRPLRDQMEVCLCAAIGCATVIGQNNPRLPNTSMMVFSGIAAEEVLISLSEAHICASGGSACHSGSAQPSAVLQAMSLYPRITGGAIRFSLSTQTTQQEIEGLLKVLPKLLEQLQSRSCVDAHQRVRTG